MRCRCFVRGWAARVSARRRAGQHVANEATANRRLLSAAADFVQRPLSSQPPSRAGSIACSDNPVSTINPAPVIGPTGARTSIIGTCANVTSRPVKNHTASHQSSRRERQQQRHRDAPVQWCAAYQGSAASRADAHRLPVTKRDQGRDGGGEVHTQSRSTLARLSRDGTRQWVYDRRSPRRGPSGGTSLRVNCTTVSKPAASSMLVRRPSRTSR